MNKRPIPLTAPPRPQIVAVRSPSGHLVGYLNQQTLTLEIKRGGRPAEQIDLKAYLQAPD